jgi:hypothetical protein
MRLKVVLTFTALYEFGLKVLWRCKLSPSRLSGMKCSVVILEQHGYVMGSGGGLQVCTGPCARFLYRIESLLAC